METGKYVHLGSLHRKSLLNEWSIGPFLAICIPGFLSLQNALGKETRNTPMNDQPNRFRNSRSKPEDPGGDFMHFPPLLTADFKKNFRTVQ